MNARFDHKEMESRWRHRWYEDNLYAAANTSTKPKRFILAEFPYPSGTGLHMGHVMRYTGPEIYSRKLRMSGFNVLFPMGWDAFGLPAENYAVKTGVHPAITIRQAVETFTSQLKALGYGIDWEREINTTDPSYYKWTQWIFLRFWEAGLAELREEPVWWCESLKTVLANEEVLEDAQGNKISERGGHPVEKRPLKQWVLKITAYAEKLLQGLEEIDFPESVKTAQRHWIGRSEGARIRFPIEGGGESLEVFTTRHDTIFGATFMAIAPEHPIVDRLKARISNFSEVERYRASVANRTQVERQAARDKTGVRLQGVEAIHPMSKSGQSLPIYVADYILAEYGTGAIMGVPAHDERDFEFATKFGLPIVRTVEPLDGAECPLPFVSEEGKIALRGDATALFTRAEQAQLGEYVSCEGLKKAVARDLEARSLGAPEVVFKLKDWIFSRQRYWGEPIPLVHRTDGKVESIAATTDPSEVSSKLPLLLPEVPDYTPSSDGASPLARNKEWVSTRDREGNPAQRETNTMPNWAGSCWYYMRYLDPKNDKAFADPAILKQWLPVDRYFGGSEHTTLHLLYSRFWHRFLYDQGLVPTPEPYAWRMNGGILLGPDGQKQSKSRGNVVDPSLMHERYGADALRMYVCFMGPYDATLPWNENGLKACRRLVETIYSLHAKVDRTGSVRQDEKLLRMYHKMVKKVGEMVDSLKLNTAVSEFMIFVNEAKKAELISLDVWKGFLKTIAPFAVFTAEDLWQEINSYGTWKKENSVHLQSWPEYDPELTLEERIILGIQVNGRVRGELDLAMDEAEESVRERVLAIPAIQKWLEGKELKKFIYIPGKIISLVVS